MNAFKIVTIILAVMLSITSANAASWGNSKAVDEPVVEGDGKVRYVRVNGRQLECLIVKTSWFKQTESCEEMARTLNPATGVRDGYWQERQLGLDKSTTTAGDIVPVLVGGVVSPLIMANGAIRAAKELHCGAECGTVIHNNNNLESNQSVVGSTIRIDNNVDVRLPCPGGC